MLTTRQNAFMAGWGISQLMNSWENSGAPERTVRVRTVQPFFDELGLVINVRQEFESGRLPRGYLHFTSGINSRLMAKYNAAASAHFDLGFALHSSGAGLIRMASSPELRRSLRDYDITSVVTDALKKASISRSLRTQWESIANEARKTTSHPEDFTNRIEQFIRAIHDHVLSPDDIDVRRGFRGGWFATILSKYALPIMIGVASAVLGGLILYLIL